VDRLASYIEACSGGSAENALVAWSATATSTILIGTQSSGQGHETAYAQLVSQELDLPLDRIKVVRATPPRSRPEVGTGGPDPFRSERVRGGRVAKARRRAQGTRGRGARSRIDDLRSRTAHPHRRDGPQRELRRAGVQAESHAGPLDATMRGVRLNRHIRTGRM
jgi:CO/xanthine dehydrogenase Mo-binding subunit